MTVMLGQVSDTEVKVECPVIITFWWLGSYQLMIVYGETTLFGFGFKTVELCVLKIE